MNILFDHQMFRIQRFGGITRIFFELIRGMSLLPECSIHWYRGFYIDSYEIADFQRNLARYWGFSRVPFGLHFFPPDDINRFLLKWFFRTSFRGYDIYHPTYYDSSLLKVIRAKRLVVTVHDMMLEKYLSDQERFGLVISGKRQLVEAADLIFVSSLSTKNDLLERVRVSPSKVRITPWASRIQEAPSISLPEKFNQVPYFLYVGTRSKYKNFEVLIRAFAESEWLRSNFKVVCFGGTSEYLKSEVELFQEYKMQDCFLYCAGDDSLLKSLYEKAEALIYTSRYEGFGLPPLEAMQCGCPVICCPTSSLPEVVGAAALFFDPDSPEELGECMRKIVDDQEFRQQLILKGGHRAGIFSWEKTVNETLEGYRVVCG